MAQIRIVDDWLRGPTSSPSHYRSVMVVAEKWAEQRVLMRAYAESRDQTLPTIRLHGQELAIGPAGINVQGPWGIHVGEGPDGHAQVIRQGLEEAARRLAGSKGNPPRLVDEPSEFDREPTGHWTPNPARLAPKRTDPRPPRVELVAPVAATRVPQVQSAELVPQMATPAPPIRRSGPIATGASTALGYTSGSGAQSAIVSLGLAPHVSARLGRLADRVVPGEFSIDEGERRALNTLGDQGSVTARALGELLDIEDAVTFMEELVKKLEAFGLGDLVEPGNPMGGEPTYRLRRA